MSNSASFNDPRTMRSSFGWSPSRKPVDGSNIYDVESQRLSKSLSRPSVGFGWSPLPKPANSFDDHPMEPPGPRKNSIHVDIDYHGRIIQQRAVERISSIYDHGIYVAIIPICVDILQATGCDPEKYTCFRVNAAHPISRIKKAYRKISNTKDNLKFWLYSTPLEETVTIGQCLHTTTKLPVIPLWTSIEHESSEVKMGGLDMLKKNIRLLQTIYPRADFGILKHSGDSHITCRDCPDFEIQIQSFTALQCMKLLGTHLKTTDHTISVDQRWTGIEEMAVEGRRIAKERQLAEETRRTEEARAIQEREEVEYKLRAQQRAQQEAAEYAEQQRVMEENLILQKIKSEEAAVKKAERAEKKRIKQQEAIELARIERQHEERLAEEKRLQELEEARQRAEAERAEERRTQNLNERDEIRMKKRVELLESKYPPAAVKAKMRDTTAAFACRDCPGRVYCLLLRHNHTDKDKLQFEKDKEAFKSHMASFEHEARLQRRIKRKEEESEAEQRAKDKDAVSQCLTTLQVRYRSSLFEVKWDLGEPRVSCADCQDRGFCVYMDSVDYRRDLMAFHAHIESNGHLKRVDVRQAQEKQRARVEAHQREAVRQANERKTAQEKGLVGGTSNPKANTTPKHLTSFSSSTSGSSPNSASLTSPPSSPPDLYSNKEQHISSKMSEIHSGQRHPAIIKRQDPSISTYFSTLADPRVEAFTSEQISKIESFLDALRKRHPQFTIELTSSTHRVKCSDCPEFESHVSAEPRDLVAMKKRLEEHFCTENHKYQYKENQKSLTCKLGATEQSVKLPSTGHSSQSRNEERTMKRSHGDNDEELVIKKPRLQPQQPSRLKLPCPPLQYQLSELRKAYPMDSFGSRMSEGHVTIYCRACPAFKDPVSDYRDIPEAIQTLSNHLKTFKHKQNAVEWSQLQDAPAPHPLR